MSFNISFFMIVVDVIIVRPIILCYFLVFIKSILYCAYVTYNFISKLIYIDDLKTQLNLSYF